MTNLLLPRRQVAGGRGNAVFTQSSFGAAPAQHTAVTALCDRPAGAEIQAAFDAALDTLRPLVAEIRPAALPIPDLGAIVEAEAYAVHADALAATPELFDPLTPTSVPPAGTSGDHHWYRARPVWPINPDDLPTAIESMERYGVGVVLKPGVGHFPPLPVVRSNR